MFITDYINEESLKLKVDGLVIHTNFSVSTIRSFNGIFYRFSQWKQIYKQ